MTPWTSQSSCQFYSLFYSIISAISLISLIRLFSTKEDERSDSKVVIQKIIAFCFHIIITAALFHYYNIVDLSTTFIFPEMSLSWILNAIFFPIVLTTILFLGPLVSKFYQDVIYEDYDIIILIRNHVVSCIFEEFFYRFLLISMLSHCYTKLQSVIISSAIFGLSHLHHFIIKSPSYILNIQSSLKPVFFTFIFGCYGSMFYIKSQSLFTPIILHSFCNYLQFPDLDIIFKHKLLRFMTLLGLFLWSLLVMLYIYN